MSRIEAHRVEDDLEALRALQEDAPELDRIEALLDRFNVFEAIGFVGQELMHSKFLALIPLRAVLACPAPLQGRFVIGSIRGKRMCQRWR